RQGAFERGARDALQREKADPAFELLPDEGGVERALDLARAPSDPAVPPAHAPDGELLGVDAEADREEAGRARASAQRELRLSVAAALDEEVRVVEEAARLDPPRGELEQPQVKRLAVLEGVVAGDRAAMTLDRDVGGELHAAFAERVRLAGLDGDHDLRD